MQPHLSCPSSEGKSSVRIRIGTKTTEHAGQYGDAENIGKAEQLYRRILKDNPGDSAALHALGVLAHRAGNHHEAVELLSKAIAADPHNAQFHNTLGLIFEVLGEIEQAVDAYEKALSLAPDYAEAHHNMAILFVSQGQYAAAVEKCRQAVSLKPDYAEAFNTMGFSFEKQQQYVEAIQSYEQAVRIKPDFAEAYNHLGVVLNEQGRSAEALENYRRALRIEPGYAEVYNNRGIVLKEQEQFAEAITHFERALELDPDFAEAHYNLANGLRDEGRCAEALKHYERAVRLKPDYAEAHWNMSLTFLLSGNFEEGWKRYRWRRSAAPRTRSRHEDLGRPRWVGESFAGRWLLVYCEQGLGDNMQFVRYLPMVKARGGTVILETPGPLAGLLKAHPAIDELVEYGPHRDSAVPFDLVASLLDMPFIFGTTLETVPVDVPYIHADPGKVEYWRTRVSGPGLKAGIAWAGSAAHGNDRYRSCKLQCFAPLMEIDNVHLYGLQKGEAAGQVKDVGWEKSLTNFADELSDFADTAAVIENLDLVISVDTAVLHLAGAMGKAAWALLPFVPEWRWMLSRSDSPWYPTMKLFRQSGRNDWEGVFQRVAEKLCIMARGNSNQELQWTKQLQVLK